MLDRIRDQRWTHLELADRWYKSLSREFVFIDSVEPRLFPRLDGYTLGCALDYSGGQKSSDFDVLSFLWFDPDELQPWFRSMTAIRSLVLGPLRTMSFKGLNDRNKRRSLLPFLSAADSLNGVLLTFAIHSSVGEYAVSSDKYRELVTGKRLRRWPRRVFAEAIRATSLFCFCASGLLKPHQRLNWLTDHESFADSQDKRKDLRILIRAGFDMLGGPQPESLLVQTPLSTSLDKTMAEDLLAVPDLVAGSMCSTLTQKYREDGIPRIGGPVEMPADRDKVRDVLGWYMLPSQTLGKILVTLFPPEFDGDNFAIRIWPGYQDNAPYCVLAPSM